MAKGNGKKSKSNKYSDSHKTSQEKAAELIEKKKEEKEVKLLENERVKAKVEEYEQKIMEAKEKLAANEKSLKEKYEMLEMELEESKEKLEEEMASLEKRKKEIEEGEKTLVKEKEEAKKKAIEEIKADERKIREQERETIYAEWEAQKSKEKSDLEKYVKDIQKKIDKELEKAHKERVEAEEAKIQMAHEDDEAIEEKYAQLSAEYKKKIDETAQMKAEYRKRLEEIESDRAELEEDKAYVKELREKYGKYSESEVLKLQNKIMHLEEVIEVNQEHIKDLSRKNASMETYMLDDEGHSFVVKISELEGKLAEAVKKNDELANMPSAEEILRLRANTQELENIRQELDDERQKRQDAENRMSSYAMSMRELENARVSAAALEALNNQLQKKLKYISEQYKSNQESKFSSLLEIDKNVDNQAYVKGRAFKGKLSDLVNYVRNFGATRNNALYYSDETIRVFFASLAASAPASRLLILQGLSGTGKSSLPILIGEALDIECKLVPVQPSWRDNRELLGYDNDFTNRFKETDFTKFLYEATTVPNQNKIWLIVLDEMNLARIEYYFADFLSVLEKPEQKWLIPLVSSYSELSEDQKPKYLNYDNEAANIWVTKNIWFVGTANNDDSTSLITDKVYDRAQVLDMDEREEPFIGKKVTPISMELDELILLFQNAKLNKKNQMTNADWEKVKEIDEYYLKEMDITFGNRIKKQMEDFVPVYIECGGTKEGAIDYLLTHKILRKLDERYEPYLADLLKELKEAINEKYGDNVFKQSIKKINKLILKINPGDTNGY